MKKFNLTNMRAFWVVMLAAGLVFTSCKDSSLSPIEEEEVMMMAAEMPLGGSSANQTTSSVTVIDDFNGPNGSWAGDFPGKYTYLEDASVLGGARELRSYRNGVTRINASAGTLEWGGTNSSTEYALYIGSWIGTHGTPTKGSSPNGGKAVNLDMNIGIDGSLIFEVLNVSFANSNIDVYLSSSTTGWFYHASVALTVGEVVVPLSSFKHYGSTNPMPAEAAADIDGVRLDGFAHNDQGSVGTGTVFAQIAYSSGTTTNNVYVSDSSVQTWDPIYPASEDRSWPSTVCYQGNDFGLTANWVNPHNAFEVTQDNGQPHPWDNSTFDAAWINSYNSMNSQGPGGHNWSKYETEVTGNGDFVVQLLADNCSWVYLSDEDGNNPQLIGYQPAVSTPGEYGVTLDGTHKLTFVIFDGGGLAGGKFRLETTESYGGTPPPPIVTNTAPVADAGADQTAEATGATTTVTLDGSASYDEDGDALTYAWSDGSTGASTDVALGVGTHTFTLTVTDTEGASSSDEVTVTITDTTAPALSFNQEVNSLWPPNHKMVLVASGISAYDLVDGDTDVQITVTSNESANGKGDGNTSEDYEIKTGFGGALEVYVRAERSGNNSGRTYTITMTTSDSNGNTASESFDVSVAKSQGRGR